MSCTCVRAHVPFQSTLSMRRATIAHVPRHVAQFISIHALHEESDFEPSVVASIFSFQSTLSMRRATSTALANGFGVMISIHALHEESDIMRYGTLTLSMLFQSTLSMRRATCRNTISTRPRHFNPRSP